MTRRTPTMKKLSFWSLLPIALMAHIATAGPEQKYLDYPDMYADVSRITDQMLDRGASKDEINAKIDAYFIQFIKPLRASMTPDTESITEGSALETAANALVLLSKRDTHAAKNEIANLLQAYQTLLKTKFQLDPGPLVINQEAVNPKTERMRRCLDRLEGSLFTAVRNVADPRNFQPVLSIINTRMAHIIEGIDQDSIHDSNYHKDVVLGLQALSTSAREETMPDLLDSFSLLFNFGQTDATEASAWINAAMKKRQQKSPVSAYVALNLASIGGMWNQATFAALDLYAMGDAKTKEQIKALLLSSTDNAKTLSGNNSYPLARHYLVLARLGDKQFLAYLRSAMQTGWMIQTAVEFIDDLLFTDKTPESLKAEYRPLILEIARDMRKTLKDDGPYVTNLLDLTIERLVANRDIFVK